MNTYAIYLRPRGALASPISSETLFGAVCWGIRILGLTDNLGDLLTQFSPPRFVFSAAFPAYASKDAHKGQWQRFYPRPISFEVDPAAVQQAVAARHAQGDVSLKVAQLKVASAIKTEVKPVAYFSEAVFTRAITGALTPAQWLAEAVKEIDDREQAGNLKLQRSVKVPVEAKKDGDLVRVGNLLMTHQESADWPKENGKLVLPWRSMARQHNQIDRVAGATVEGLLFYEDELHFAPQAGLWAVARANPEEMETLVRPALRYLADTGLGANRTVGKGQFDIDVEAFTLPDGGQNANGFLTLSRYLPAPDEAPAGEPLAYRLTTVRAKREKKYPVPAAGSAALPIYKLGLRLFEPGSVFPLKQRREVYGQLAAAIPGGSGVEATFQSGLALPIFVRAG